MNWERIDDYTERAKVHKGWLVKVSQDVLTDVADGRRDVGYEWRIAICFVPDPMHGWTL